MQSKQIALLCAAVVVLLVVCAYAYWYFVLTIRLPISSLIVLNGGTVSAFAKMAGVSATATKWKGKKVTYSTKSLGTFESTVASVSVADGVAAISSAPGAYMNTVGYSHDASDQVMITLGL